MDGGTPACDATERNILHRNAYSEVFRSRRKLQYAVQQVFYIPFARSHHDPFQPQTQTCPPLRFFCTSRPLRFSVAPPSDVPASGCRKKRAGSGPNLSIMVDSQVPGLLVTGHLFENDEDRRTEEQEQCCGGAVGNLQVLVLYGR